VDLVLTTGYGAGLIGHCVARAHPSRPRFIFASKERMADGRTEVSLQPEYRNFFAEGGRVLVVEDILTTGETVRRLARLVDSMGGRVVGVGAVWRRSAVLPFRYPVFTVVTRTVPTYPPEECPMCRQGIPITTDLPAGASEEEAED